MHSWHIRIFGILAALLLFGCATPVSTNIKPSAEHVAKYNDLPAVSVVASLEKNVNEAKSANMPFLAPDYFREASQVLAECQSSLGKVTQEVLATNAAKGDAILEKGRAIMAIVQYRFAKELEYKTQLEEYNAPKLLPREYESAIGDLSGLIEKVEREQPDNIDQEKERLLKSMRDLVIKTVQEGALRESEAINMESKKKGADMQAPVTYAEALRVYRESKNQIAAAYRDKALVQRLGAGALFAARHAQQVNERVGLLQTQLKISAAGSTSMGGPIVSGGVPAGTEEDVKPSGAEKVTVEKIVLQEEGRLLGISSALGLKDLRDLPLEKQVEEIRRAAADAAHQPGSKASEYEARLEAANKGIQQGVAELEQKDKQLTAKDQKLEAQAAQLAEKEKQLAKKDKQLAEKNAQIKTLKDKLAAMKLL
jgi:hypothetical protein